MAIEVQTITCIPSQTAYFTFQEAPQYWVVGLTLFRLDYGLADYHWVETLSVSLEVNLPEQASATANQLAVTVQATLSDASGHKINTSGSYTSTVTVACVAVTGSADNGTVLVNVPGVTQQTGRDVQLPSTNATCTVLETCLSGVDFSYNTTDHEFQGASVTVGVDLQGGLPGIALVTATADMWDASGNHAVNPTIDAGFLATTDTPPPFMVQQVTAYNYAPPPALAFSSPVGQAIVLIQGFNVVYASGDHSVHTIQVGCGEPGQPSSQIQSVSGSNVTLGPCWAYTDNSTGDQQDSALSTVNLLVIAVPPAPGRS